MRKTSMRIAALCCLLTSSAFAQGDIEAGKWKFAACEGCHAIPGYTNAYPTYHVPRVAGQHAAYLTDALKGYRDGSRQHGTMRANAANLTDQDILDIAAYLSALDLGAENTLRLQGDAEAGALKSASCQACHGAEGESIAPNFPKLAGQYEDYLRHALAAYRDGSRNNAIMRGFAQGLSNQDIADLAAYYSSRTPRVSFVEP